MGHILSRGNKQGRRMLMLVSLPGVTWVLTMSGYWVTSVMQGILPQVVGPVQSKVKLINFNLSKTKVKSISVTYIGWNCLQPICSLIPVACKRIFSYPFIFHSMYLSPLLSPSLPLSPLSLPLHLCHPSLPLSLALSLSLSLSLSLTPTLPLPLSPCLCSYSWWHQCGCLNLRFDMCTRLSDDVMVELPVSFRYKRLLYARHHS